MKGWSLTAVVRDMLISCCSRGGSVEGESVSLVVLSQMACSDRPSYRPVWFGCDVGQFSDSTLGIMDTALFDLETPFGVTLGMNKAQRLQT